MSVTIYVSSWLTHLFSFSFFHLLFRFYCSLPKEPFYIFLNNFPWLHAYYKVFSGIVIADCSELARTVWSWPICTRSCSPLLQAVLVLSSQAWHRNLHGRGGGTTRILWLLLSRSCSSHQFLGESSSLMLLWIFMTLYILTSCIIPRVLAAAWETPQSWAFWQQELVRSLLPGRTAPPLQVLGGHLDIEIVAGDIALIIFYACFNMD